MLTSFIFVATFIVTVLPAIPEKTASTGMAICGAEAKSNKILVVIFPATNGASIAIENNAGTSSTANFC